MDTIKLPGCEGNFVECECEPIEKNGDNYKLRVKGSQLTHWCTRQQWEDAMYEACKEEVYREIYDEVVSYYQQMEREDKYRAWLKDEAG